MSEVFKTHPWCGNYRTRSTYATFNAKSVFGCTLADVHNI